MKYDVVIGIEIHLELLTKTKMFSPGPVCYGGTPNSVLNEVVLGYPGSMPTVNEEGVKLAIKASHLLKMEIDNVLSFDRKHYYYHDLPKGFQITQQLRPIGKKGFIKIGKKTINLERLHIEEDTAKTINKEESILIDYNRAGNALIEIVTDPDMETAEEVVAFVDAIKSLMFFAGISNARMEEGSLRCDVNISLKPQASTTLGTKVEIKNINSTQNISTSIEFEINRQTKLLDNDEIVIQETRRFDEDTQATISMRAKEAASGYKYMIETNILPITLSEEYIQKTIASIPCDIRELKVKLLKTMDTEADIEQLLKQTALKDFILYYTLNNISTKSYFKILTNDFVAISNIISEIKITPKLFSEIIEMIDKDDLPQKVWKAMLKEAVLENTCIEELFKKHNIEVISDEKILLNIIKPLITPRAIKEYSDKPDRVEKSIMGQVMKQTQGNACTKTGINLIKKELVK